MSSCVYPNLRYRKKEGNLVREHAKRRGGIAVLLALVAFVIATLCVPKTARAATLLDWSDLGAHGYNINFVDDEADIPRDGTHPYINVFGVSLQNAAVSINCDTQDFIHFDGDRWVYASFVVDDASRAEYDEALAYCLSDPEGTMRENFIRDMIAYGESIGQPTTYGEMAAWVDNTELGQNYLLMYKQAIASENVKQIILPDPGEDSLFDIYYANVGLLSDTGQIVHMKLSLTKYVLYPFKYDQPDGDSVMVWNNTAGGTYYDVFGTPAIGSYDSISSDLAGNGWNMAVGVMDIYDGHEPSMRAEWPCEEYWDITFWVDSGDGGYRQVDASAISGERYVVRQFFYDLDVNGWSFVNEDSSYSPFYGGRNRHAENQGESVTLLSGYLDNYYFATDTRLDAELYDSAVWFGQMSHDNELWNSYMVPESEWGPGDNRDRQWKDALSIDAYAHLQYRWTGTGCSTGIDFFVQYYDNGTLKVSKETVGGDPGDSFWFYVEVQSPSGWTGQSMAYTTVDPTLYPIVNGSGDEIPSSVYGNGRIFQLGHGQAAYVTGLAEGMRCNVAEYDYLPNYATKVNGIPGHGTSVIITRDDGVNIPRSNTVAFTNEPPASLDVRKASGLPAATDGNPNYSLAGAIYEVYADSAYMFKVATMVTDAAGEAWVYDEANGTIGDASLLVPSGTYYVVEKRSSQGFKLDSSVSFDTPYIVNASVGGTYVVDSTEPPAVGSIAVIKASSNPYVQASDLAGAKFQVINKNSFAIVYGNSAVAPDGVVATITTAFDGSQAKATLSGLPLGSYAIRETNPPAGHAAFAADVAVTLTESDTTVSMTVEDDFIATTSWAPDVVKLVNGHAPGNSQSFTFQLKDSASAVVATGTSDAEGNVAWDAEVVFDGDDIGQTFVYTVTEVAGSAPRMVYDSHTLTATVSVALVSGELRLTESYSGAKAFGNILMDPPSFTVTGTKALTDRPWALEAGEFRFELVDSEGHVVGTTSNRADGTFEFDSVLLGDAVEGSTYTFHVREIAGADASIEYDGHVETIHVSVSRSGNALVANVAYDADGDSFTNAYRQPFVMPATGMAGIGLAATFGTALAALAAIAIVAMERQDG